MKNFRFLSAASAELFEAVDFYNEREPGIGFCFLDAVDATIRQITDDPLSGPFVGNRVQRRRCMVFRSMCCTSTTSPKSSS